MLAERGQTIAWHKVKDGLPTEEGLYWILTKREKKGSCSPNLFLANFITDNNHFYWAVLTYTKTETFFSARLPLAWSYVEVPTVPSLETIVSWETDNNEEENNQ